MINTMSVYPVSIDPLLFFQDVDLDHKEFYDTYNNLILEGKYGEAGAFLSQQNGLYGYNADLFNAIENRIYALQTHLQNKEKNNPFVSSEEEPTELKDDMIWI